MGKLLHTDLRVLQISNNNNNTSLFWFSFGPEKQRVELIIFFCSQNNAIIIYSRLSLILSFLSLHPLTPLPFLPLIEGDDTNVFDICTYLGMQVYIWISMTLKNCCICFTFNKRHRYNFITFSHSTLFKNKINPSYSVLLLVHF